MEKALKFTRTHWKKLAVCCVPLIYGVHYVKNDYQNTRHMRQICNVVNQYPITKNNKVLVVLNPVANKKKSEKMFKKYYEPVLHMAGFAVDVIKTKHIGHAKSLMEELEQMPDILVVAGGDGTSSEVVTGLVRRNGKICPILFLPLGEKSKTAFNLMQINSEGNSDTVKNVSQCMLPLVQDKTQTRAIMKYELVENDNQEQNKPIFGILAFSWGILKDIEINEKKYWYFGACKHYASALFASMSNKLRQSIDANIISQPPCSGCTKCKDAVKNKYMFNISNLFKPRVASTQPAVQMKEHELCSTENCYKMDAKQIDITCKQNSENFFALSTDIIENITSPTDFLSNMLTGKKIQPSSSLESRTLEIIPTHTEDQTFYIDGEGYDARHIKLSFLPNALKFYTLAESAY